MDDWHARIYRKRQEKVSADWPEIRKRILERDGYTCYRCEKTQKRSMTVHHIIPRDEGGGDYDKNLITLCMTCHDIVEVAQCRSLVEIIATLEEEPIYEEPDESLPEREESFTRPVWHKWVYGGVRHKI